MKKLLSLLLATALVCTLFLPALAWEEPDTKYPTFEQYLDFYRASADPETKELAYWLDAWIAAHTQEYAAFDADAYFDANIRQDNGVNKNNWFFGQLSGYKEEHFKAEMCNHWLTGLFRAEYAAQKGRDASAQYPEEFADFDADAWFTGYYGGILNIAKERYMEAEGLDAVAFKRDMFAEWALGRRCRYNDVVITVDGTPILFTPVVYDGMSIPSAVDGRIYAPLPTLEKTLGFQSSYDKQSGILTCTKGEQTVRFYLANGSTPMDFPNMPHFYQTNVYPYIPLRALAEGLGYTVIWSQALRTAQLTTPTEKD